MPAVLPHGRLFRTVLRRCEDGRRRARHRADHARRTCRRACTHVRRSRAFGGELPCPADPRRLPRSNCRTGGDARRGEGTGKARRHAFFESPRKARYRTFRDCGYLDGRCAAGAAPRQHAGRRMRGARFLRRCGLRYLDGRDAAGRMRAEATFRRTGADRRKRSRDGRRLGRYAAGCRNSTARGFRQRCR